MELLLPLLSGQSEAVLITAIVVLGAVQIAKVLKDWLDNDKDVEPKG